MEIPYNAWYQAIGVRRSRRRYDPVPPDSRILERIRQLCANFRPFPEVRAVLVSQRPDEVLKGLVGPYGKIQNAPAFLVFIGRRDDPAVQEKIGYLGEGMVLEAVSLGLATCWVGLSFRPEAAASLGGAGGEEIVPAVAALGFQATSWTAGERLLTGFGLAHRRKPLPGMVGGLPAEDWPEWVKEGLAAARLAPSAVNRQPWRFRVEADAVTVSVDNLNDTYHISKRLDCGIAMLHLELGARKAGRTGRWELLPAPRVGRFTVDPE